MKKLKDVLNEALDKPYGPIQWKGQQGFGDSIIVKGLFTTDQKIQYQIEFVIFPGKDGGDEANVEFKEVRSGGGPVDIGGGKNSPVGITGKGDAFRVFATVIEGIKDIVSRGKTLNVIRFDSFKDLPTRVRLYDRLVKVLARKIGFKADIDKTSDPEVVLYTLTRKK